jgi:hypothetical protein
LTHKHNPTAGYENINKEQTNLPAMGSNRVGKYIYSLSHKGKSTVALTEGVIQPIKGEAKDSGIDRGIKSACKGKILEQKQKHMHSQAVVGKSVTGNSQRQGRTHRQFASM